MAKIVFRLNGVPESEAEQVRELLSANQFEYYETDAGRWGVSLAAIWLQNDEDFGPARELIEDFQQQYYQSQRADFEQRKARGEVPTFWQLLRQNTAASLLYWSLILVVVLFSIMPIYHFFND